ncbi:hypothetical protein D3C71_1630770 [compost metagenome]
MYIKTNLSTSIDAGSYYTVPALVAGYSPTNIDYVKTDIFLNNSLVMTIQVDSTTAKNYANNIINENDVIKNAKVQTYNVNNTAVNSTAQSTSTNNNVIESTIKGNFRGFKNGTVFKLANGQIWEQTSFDIYTTYKYNPGVTIYKDGSTFYMLVDDIDKKVTVKRIK